MSAQRNDRLQSSRVGIIGAITIGMIEDLIHPYDPSTAVRQVEGEVTYYVWERKDGSGYIAKKMELGALVGEFTDALPIPTDLTTITYT